MAASREVEMWDTFNGGLNLTTQTQSLQKTETPDSVNMDFGARGGFILRGGFRSQVFDADLLGARIIGVAETATPEVLIQSTTGRLLQWNGTTLTDTVGEVLGTERIRMANSRRQGVDVSYLSNATYLGVREMWRWTGSAVIALGHAWNNDYTTPTLGNMPVAAHIAAHAGFMFVADTVESSVRYPARVRFSHEQNVESWAEADYFEVGEPGVNDPITALVPFNDALLVFKKSSVWAVYGYDRDSFVLERIASATGVCSCGAVAVNAGVAYWFSTDGQLMAWNGRDTTVLSQPIDWWATTGRIVHGGAHRLMWSDGRLWMSLEAGPDEDVSYWMFIWDPIIKAFSRYDRQATEMVHWTRLGSDGDPLFLDYGSENLYRYDPVWETDQGVQSNDWLLDGLGEYLLDDAGERLYSVGAQDQRPISGYYRTAWMTAGETATRKRWKRPRVTGASSSGATIKVDVYLDFDDQNVARSFEFTIDAPSGSGLWGDMNWGDDWHIPAAEYYEFSRLGSAGSGYAVSFKFSSTTNLGRWWIDSIAVPFRRKSIR